MRAAIYTRVSSARQAEEGLSLPEQRKRCEAFATGKGWTVLDTHVYEERGVSGAKASRPALDRLMAAVEAGAVDVVVTPWADRLGRSAVHSGALFERFNKAGVAVYSADGMRLGGSKPADKLITRNLVGFAEYERDMLIERVKAVVPAKRERGSYNGGPRPFGYAHNPAALMDKTQPNLLPIPEEVDVCHEAARRFLAGESMRSIELDFDSRRIRRPRDGSWLGRLAEIFDLPIYAGIVGGGAQGRHVPIFDAATWAKLRAARGSAEQRAAKTGGRKPSVHLLGGKLLRCECGATMNAKKGTGGRADTYRCSLLDRPTTREAAKLMTHTPPLPRIETDATIRAFIAGHVFSPGMARRELERDPQASIEEANRSAQREEAEVKKLERRLMSAAAYLADGDMDRDTYRALKADTEAELIARRKRAADHRRAAEALAQPSEALQAAVEGMRLAASQEATEDTVGAQRAALSRLFAYFEVLCAPVDSQASDEFPDTPSLVLKPRGSEPRRVFLLPMPLPEVAARFGAFPLDALADFSLSPNVRIDLPIRCASVSDRPTSAASSSPGACGRQT